MLGFDHVCLSLYGKNHSLQFENNELTNSIDTIVSKIEKEEFDCSIIVGTDPISHFPKELSKKLTKKPLILIDNKKSATSNFADVFLPTAITGIESNGLAFRLDHVPIELHKVINPPNNLPSDEEILNNLIKGLIGGWNYGDDIKYNKNGW